MSKNNAGLGNGITPKHPWLHFVFSLIVCYEFCQLTFDVWPFGQSLSPSWSSGITRSIPHICTGTVNNNSRWSWGGWVREPDNFAWKFSEALRQTIRITLPGPVPQFSPDIQCIHMIWRGGDCKHIVVLWRNTTSCHRDHVITSTFLFCQSPAIMCMSFYNTNIDPCLCKLWC